jgi:sugar phosphate isomerase/epimerase
MGDSYESFYAGGYSSLDPEFNKQNLVGGHKNIVGQITSTTGVGTANQLNEVVARIKEGVKNVELQPVANPDLIEQVPTQHWDEMRAIMKLTGVKPSVHAPILDPVGFGKRGWEGEQARLETERRFKSVIEKAHILDPDGNTPVVFHAANDGYGPSYIPGDVDKGEKRFRKVEDVAINIDTGELAPLKEKKQYSYLHPEDLKGDPKKNSESGTTFTVENALASANLSTWDNSLTQIADLQKKAEEVLGPAYHHINEIKEAVKTSSPTEEDLSSWNVNLDRIKSASVFAENVELSLRGAFDKLYEFGTDEQRKELEKLAKKIEKEKEGVSNELMESLERGNMGGLLSKDKNKQAQEIEALKTARELGIYKEAVQEIASLTTHGRAPKIFKPIEEFSLEKTATTFGNVAWHGYDKFGDKAPIVAMENMYQGMQFSRAEDMEKLVKETKKVFIENAKKKGMDEDEAKEKADKIIGVTWDVGHLNLMKKRGFTDEDVVDETKKIHKLVKHIHLTDNFGHNDSHLAPGMGNVPIKKILEELEKNGKYKEMRKVIEAGALVMQGGLGMSPFATTLKAFGSPLYGMQNAPYWNQASGMMGSYFGGYGDSNPSTHHSMYGAGFTTLPRELGGNIPGTNSRFSGTPNA